MTGIRRIHGILKRVTAAPWPVRVSFTRPPEVRIIMNSRVNMTRGKYAAQAVHAALLAAGVPHGRVIVLGGSYEDIMRMDVQVRDAGRTEVSPGTLTAGCSFAESPRPGVQMSTPR